MNTHDDTGSSPVAGYRVAMTALAIYLLAFIALAVDLMTRIWTWRARLTPAEMTALSFFEVSRSIGTAGAVALVLWMAVRRTAPRYRPLGLAIALAAVWHTKAFAFTGFPGPRQEMLAVWLNAHDVPRALLSFVFASPAWALWGAVAAMLRFSVMFPRPLAADVVQADGAADRQGLMRSNAVAGADIGDVFRNLSAHVLRTGWFRAGPLTILAVVWSAVFQVAGGAIALRVMGGVILGIAAGLIVTNLRAGRNACADAEDGRVILWLTRGASLGLILFAASAATSLLGPAAFAGVVLLGSAPAVVLVCVWLAVTAEQRR